MVSQGFFSGSARRSDRIAGRTSYPSKMPSGSYYGGEEQKKKDFLNKELNRFDNFLKGPGGTFKVENDGQNKFRNQAIAQGQEDDSGYEGYLRKIYGLEKTDKEYKNMPGFLKRDIRDSYRDDVESGTYKDPYGDQNQSSILKRAGDFVANIFTPPAVAGTLEGKPTRFTMGESNNPLTNTPNVGDMVSNIGAAVEAGGMGGLGSSAQSSRVRTLGRPQPRVQSPMEAGMGPGAAKARAMAKARNAAKESGTASPSMSGADRAKALARARIARKKKSTSSGTGFGRSTSSSRRSTGRAGRRGGSAGSAGSRSRGGTSRGSSRSGTRSSSSRGQGSRSRSTSRSRGGVSRGSRRRGGRRGRRGGRRCDIRCKINISPLINTNLVRDDLAELAYFVKEIK